MQEGGQASFLTPQFGFPHGIGFHDTRIWSCSLITHGSASPGRWAICLPVSSRRGRWLFILERMPSSFIFNPVTEYQGCTPILWCYQPFRTNRAPTRHFSPERGLRLTLKINNKKNPPKQQQRKHSLAAARAENRACVPTGGRTRENTYHLFSTYCVPSTVLNALSSWNPMHNTIPQDFHDKPHVVGEVVPPEAKWRILPEVRQLESRVGFEPSSG